MEGNLAVSMRGNGRLRVEEAVLVQLRQKKLHRYGSHTEGETFRYCWRAPGKDIIHNNE